MNKINISSNDNLDIARAAQKEIQKSGGNNKSAPIEKKPIVGEDTLAISDKVGEVKGLVDRVKDLPDIRTEKVDALREQIKAGTYQPSSNDIADAILKDAS